MIEIVALPLLEDNYAWLVKNEAGACAVVDPSEGAPVVDRIEVLGLHLEQVLLTHHHWDHVGGLDDLVKRFGSQLLVTCSEYDRSRIPQANVGVQDGDTLTVLGQEVHCLGVPGHTLGAVAFHMPSARALFTGDTLFTAGCGRLFEGTPAQMWASLQQLSVLPTDTLVYCGHEYTCRNLEFARTVEPENRAVADRLSTAMAQRQAGRPTVPATLQVELQTNPFLRADLLASGQAPAADGLPVGSDGEAMFTAVRQRRDAF